MSLSYLLQWVVLALVFVWIAYYLIFRKFRRKNCSRSPKNRDTKSRAADDLCGGCPLADKCGKKP